MPKLCALLLVALAGALTAGCGGSSTSASSSQTTTAAATTSAGAASTPASATTTSTGARTPTGEAKKPREPRSVEACKRKIPGPPTIAASAAERIRAICDGDASGEPAALHKVAREVCTELIYAANVHPGEYETRMLAYCNTR
jgi:hypothetical protein